MLPGSPSVPSPCRTLVLSPNVRLVEHQNFYFEKRVLQIAPNAGRLPVDLRKDDLGGLHGRGRSNASSISLAKCSRCRFKLCFQHRSNSKNLAEEKVRQISRAAHRRFPCAAGVGKRALITHISPPPKGPPRGGPAGRHVRGKSLRFFQTLCFFSPPLDRRCFFFAFLESSRRALQHIKNCFVFFARHFCNFSQLL